MKIGVIGAGSVGSAAAFALIMSGVASKVVLIDKKKEKAEAEAMDIAHAAPFASAGKIMAGDYADLENSDIVIITAGANQKEGETRTDLLARNVKIFAEIIPQVVHFAPQAILLIAANPVDIMTEVALQLSGFVPERVIGSGTVLDTARFRTLLGYFLGVSTKSVHADVLGEHGDSEVLVWSNAEAGTLLLEDFATSVDKVLNDAKRAEIEDGVVNAAYKIIAGKGATCFGVAGALMQICRAIGNNDYSILTVSSHHSEVEGVSDVCLSLPTIINRKGVHHVIMPHLSADEHSALKRSAQKMQDFAKQAYALLQKTE